MSLIDLNKFTPIWGPLRGKRIGYVRGEYGNVGDTWQEWSTYLQAKEFGVDLYWLGPVRSGRWNWDWEPGDGSWDGIVPDCIDELLLFGGGNMGLGGSGSSRLRRIAVNTGLPITCLPNSWRDYEDVPNCRRYFVRERGSLRYRPDAIVAPDMALGFPYDKVYFAPSNRLIAHKGLFLRCDLEGQFSDTPGNQGAPFDGVSKRDAPGYLRKAAMYRVIVTDALHFVIAGLYAAAEVYLLPGSYHKNRSMYETWLKDLGCNWADTPEEALSVS